jgi:hypothetical protein
VAGFEPTTPRPGRFGQSFDAIGNVMAQTFVGGKGAAGDISIPVDTSFLDASFSGMFGVAAGPKHSAGLGGHVHQIFHHDRCGR